jgi:hypothetical protein
MDGRYGGSKELTQAMISGRAKRGQFACPSPPLVSGVAGNDFRPSEARIGGVGARFIAPGVVGPRVQLSNHLPYYLAGGAINLAPIDMK